ncbi:ATP-dependent RNA helicase dbp7 [Thoreauomyces humboldtii]|nr:ATP-dependent RNA helicase dbp7 [Thoreauomyces humboldtii]
MDDGNDGIMLNWSTEPPPQTTATQKLKVRDVAANLKRGGWRTKRLAAKKVVQRVHKSATEAAAAAAGAAARAAIASALAKGDAEAAAAAATGSKRKLDSSTDGNGNPKRARDGGSMGDVDPTPWTKAPIPGTKQVVSSIFTSLPDAFTPGQFTISTSAKSTVPRASGAVSDAAPAPAPTPAPAQPVFDTTTFAGLGLDPLICSHLANKLNFKAPTLIQRASLPSLLESRDRDHVLQAQTGSGKTLSFLLPILHRLLLAEQERQKGNVPQLQRSVGTLAIVLAPTRELAKQIETVLNSLLTYKGHQQKADDDEDEEEEQEHYDASATHHRHWIVAGNVMGGEQKKKEKSRLRKGVTILVSTPGRLLDHLKTTKSFELGNLRWLVLDEADRLLELGFEDTLRDILRILGEKKEAAVRARTRLFVRAWPPNKQIILCSATIQGVQKLAEEALVDPVFLKAETRREKAKRVNEEIAIRKAEKEAVAKSLTTVTMHDASSDEEELMDEGGDEGADEEDGKLTVPTQLVQTYVTVPAKLRLVTLIGLFRKLTRATTPCKVMVFVSSTDSVDFHYHLLANGHKGPEEEKAASDPTVQEGEEEDPWKKFEAGIDDYAGGDDEEEQEQELDANGNPIEKSEHPKARYMLKPDDPELLPPTPALLQTGATTPLLPSTVIFKLHGSLPQAARIAAYKNFVGATSHAILFCTDVAARGLDMPDVSHIIQYDPPADTNDYVHRVGRTARLGRAGTALLFLLPSELGYVEVLAGQGFVVTETPADGLLSHLLDYDPKDRVSAVNKKGRKPYELPASNLHMKLERFVLTTTASTDLAQSAFKSHVRAYATHAAAERHVFHIRKLHLGHVAKSFALREAPTDLLVDAARRSKEDKMRKEAEKKSSKPGSSMYKRKAGLLVASASEFGDGGVRSIMSIGAGDKNARKRRKGPGGK